MLVLTRKLNEVLVIGDDVEITVLSITRDRVRLGIQAPREIPVFRKEIYLRVGAECGESAGDEVAAMLSSAGRSAADRSAV